MRMSAVWLVFIACNSGPEPAAGPAAEPAKVAVAADADTPPAVEESPPVVEPPPVVVDPIKDPRPEPTFTEFVAAGLERSAVSELPCPEGSGLAKPTAKALVCAKLPAKKVKHGPAVWFSADGKMEAQGYHEANKRTGVWVEWHPNGPKKTVMSYNAGVLHGTYASFWANGNRQTDQEFNMGKKQGPVRNWSEDGELETVVRFENDKEVAKLFPAP